MASGRSAEEGVWQGDAYAVEAGHHRSYDDWFLAQHRPQPGDRVVDAGCGTGDFTARLAALVTDGQVIGVDPDPSMLAAAGRHRADNLEFRQGRLQQLDRVVGSSWADLVVSRAVFHWLPVSDYRRSYEAVFHALRPGGAFHAESAGAGNVRRMRAVLDEVAAELGLGPAAVTMLDADVPFELLEQVGFEVGDAGVTTVAQRRRFTRDELVGFVHTQAALAYVTDAAPDVRDAFLAEAEARLHGARRADGTYDQTFVRLHVLCRRPGHG